MRPWISFYLVRREDCTTSLYEYIDERDTERNFWKIQDAWEKPGKTKICQFCSHLSELENCMAQFDGKSPQCQRWKTRVKGKGKIRHMLYRCSRFFRDDAIPLSGKIKRQLDPEEDFTDEQLFGEN